MLASDTKTFRLRRKASVIRRCQFPRDLNLRMSGDEYTPFPVNCGRCWACVANQKDQLVGRVAAHAIGCAEILLITATYDDARGPDAWAGARQRNVRHAQLFKKRLRKRETDGYVRYNREELEAAERERRAPVLVPDPKRSRMKFIDSYEFGEKRGRGHWHFMLLLEGTWAVPFALFERGSIRAGMSEAKRAWDIPQIYGPLAAKRSDTLADDPGVYDHRAKGNQEWDVWPYGQSRIDSVTHEVDAPDGKRLAANLDLSKAVDYATKYVVKGMASVPDGFPWNQRIWTEDQIEQFLREPRPSLVRSMSQGIGYDYARAFGVARAQAGVPLNDYRFRIDEIRAPRKKFSGERFENKLIDLGVSAMTAMQFVEYRRQFEMVGGMRAQAFRAYQRVRRAKLGDTAERGAGDGYLRDVYRYETDQHSALMKSHDYQLALALQPASLRELTPMLEELPAVPVYEVDPETGDWMNRPGRNGTKFRKVGDRLKERRAAIAANLAAYRAVRRWLADAPLVQAVEHVVSCSKLDDIDTRFWRERLGKNSVEYVLSKADAKRYERNRRACLEGMREDYHVWAARLEALEASIEREQYEALAPGVPRNTLVHPIMPTDQIWSHVNGSSDYQWPRLREELIARYCRVETLDPDTRLVCSPDWSRWFLQRRHHTDEPHLNYFPETKEIRTARKTTIWRSRELALDELRSVRAGAVLLVSSSHNDPVFSGEEPLSPVVIQN